MGATWNQKRIIVLTSAESPVNCNFRRFSGNRNTFFNLPRSGVIFFINLLLSTRVKCKKKKMEFVLRFLNVHKIYRHLLQLSFSS